jgi:hypothetical protein
MVQRMLIISKLAIIATIKVIARKQFLKVIARKLAPSFIIKSNFKFAFLVDLQL